MDYAGTKIMEVGKAFLWLMFGLFLLGLVLSIFI